MAVAVVVDGTAVLVAEDLVVVDLAVALVVAVVDLAAAARQGAGSRT